MTERIVTLTYYTSGEGLACYAQNSKKESWKKVFLSTSDPEFDVRPGRDIETDKWIKTDPVQNEGTCFSTA